MTTKHRILRILSVLTVLALVASLGVVTAAPAGATPGGAAVVTVFPLGAGATNATYNITFFAPAAIPLGSAILITFPPGTGNVTAIPLAPPGSVNITGVGTNPAVNITVIGHTVSLVTAGATGNITAGMGVTVFFGPAAGITNPGPGIHTLTVAGITSAPYSIHGLALAPTSGVPGTAVTATGAGFPATAAGVLHDPVLLPAIAPVTFMTTAAGAIPPATVVTILPDAPAGIHTINATVGNVTKSANFTVLAVPVVPITLSPALGPRYGIVTVTAPNVTFATTAPGIITAPGVITPTTFMTNATGGFSHNVTILGVAPFGLAAFTVTVGLVSHVAHFTVIPAVPTVTLSPTSGARGTNVTVTGAHFPPGTAGVIMAPGIIAPVTINTTPAGAIPPATVVTILPGAAFGPATFTVTVGVVSATATFTVHAPGITLSPIGGVPGANVTVTGVGFPITTPGIITAPGVISPTGIPTTNATGGFSANVTLLLGAPLGPATFTVTVDPPGPPLPVTATATYTVGITPAIILTPAIGFGGTVVRVTGLGFPHGTAGTITAPGVISPVTFTTTVAGILPAIPPVVPPVPGVAVTILPGAPVGPATITVTVAGVTATATFTVAGVLPPIVVVPPVPVLEGLEVVWPKLGKSVWHFRAGNWFQHHTDPKIHALIPVGQRLATLEVGQAYWIYLEKPITDVLVGGKLRTLPAGWHNIGWIR
jgi:hypothetical protein